MQGTYEFILILWTSQNKTCKTYITLNRIARGDLIFFLIVLFFPFNGSRTTLQFCATAINYHRICRLMYVYENNIQLMGEGGQSHSLRVTFHVKNIPSFLITKPKVKVMASVSHFHSISDGRCYYY